MPKSNFRLVNAETYTARMLGAAANLGFATAIADDLPAARVIAAKLMAHQVASEATLLSILALQPASTLIFRDGGEVAGMVATLLLRPDAAADLKTGAFDGLTPSEALLARGDDPVAFYYLWGLAGATKTASAAAMELSRLFRYEALADLTCYAVAATPIGRHVGITRLGMTPVRHPDDNLLVSPPQLGRIAA
jgi:hypothetical protein